MEMSSEEMYLKDRPPPYTESEFTTTSRVVQQSGATPVVILMHVPNSMDPKAAPMTYNQQISYNQHPTTSYNHTSYNQQIVTRVEHKISKRIYLFALLICFILALCVCVVLVLLYR